MAKKEKKEDAPAEKAPEEKPVEAENGEGGEGTAEGEGGEKKKFKLSLKLILMIAIPAVLLLGGGGAALYFTGMLDSLLGKAEGGEHGAEASGGHAAGGGGHGEEGEGHGPSIAFIKIPTMIVNLNSQDGTPRYLRLSVELELENPADAPAVEAVIPRVVDQFQTYLRELRIRDLRGSAGIYRLQMELLWRVNQAAHPVKVKDVLFQEILIQ